MPERLHARGAGYTLKALLVVLSIQIWAAADPASALPAETLMLVRVRDGSRCLKDVRQLDVVKRLAAREWGHALGIALEGAARSASVFLSDVPLSKWADIVAQDVALAVWEEADSGKRTGWVIAADLGERTTEFDRLWLDVFLPRLSEAVPDMRIEPAQGSGEYAFVLRDGSRIKAARKDCWLLLGSPETVKVCLAAAGDQERALVSQARYREPMSRLSTESGVFVWMNAERLWQRAAPELERNARKRRDLTNMGLLDVRAAAARARVRDGLVEEHIVLELAPSRGGILGLIAGLTPRAIQAPAKVPKEMTAYAAFAFKDGIELAKKIENLIERTGGENAIGEFRSGVLKLEETLQINLHGDVYKALGSEAFAAIEATGMVDAAKARLPLSWANVEFLFGIHCSDSNRIIETANFALTSDWAVNAGLQWNVRQADRVPIYTLSHQGRPMLSPSYAAVGDYLLIALRERTLANAVRSISGGRCVKETDAWKRAARPVDPSLLELYVSLQPFLPAFAQNAAAKVDDDAKPWWPYLVDAARECDAVHVRVQQEPLGLAARCRSPLGVAVVPAALIGVGELLKGR